MPLKNIQIIPFNLDHATKTGEFAKIIFKENGKSIERLVPRAIIPNDSKLFAQADMDSTITHFITSDERSNTTIKHLSKGTIPKFEIINIETPFNETFGILDL